MIQSQSAMLKYFMMTTSEKYAYNLELPCLYEILAGKQSNKIGFKNIQTYILFFFMRKSA